MKIQTAQPTPDNTLNIALDTLRIGKQALIFLGTKPSAEKTAEEISKKLNIASPELEKTALESLQSLTKPTKQCERLAKCIRKGVAFHHSGLTSKQRQIVEDSFRTGKIKIICCTPTLAAGLDLPAYRAIIRDLKRFGRTGMEWIPVLEYLQMSGRAGRPKYDTEGQAITVCSSKKEKEEITERYINGQPEDIYSKLAAEPALRTCILSLAATRFVKTKQELMNFFSSTFWARQYGDLAMLESNITRILSMLEAWGFINAKNDFTSASELNSEKISATPAGKRVAELYIDPLTASRVINSVQRSNHETSQYPYLLMISTCLEMRPLLRAGTKDHEAINEALIQNDGKLLQEEPSMYDEEYEDFINGAKTALFLNDWIEEKDEEYLLERYRVRPGEIHAKLETANWLLYSAAELSKLLSLKEPARQITKLRVRVKYGAKEELFPLLKLKGIGRARARRLYSHGIKDLGEARKAEDKELSVILGPKVAQDIKEQLTQKPELTKNGLDSFL
ncbi:hypothetical protein HY640_03220 [Candidatus Woesearchaeota archaeon]|nr:hypothetical protein [Candidatus Woesearchaeota archaeon]